VTKVLVDINLILDILLDRRPHVNASAALWAAIETESVEGMLSAHALTTIHYLVSREKDSAATKRIVASLLKIFSVAAVDKSVIQEALALPSPDFEDSVTAAAARLAGCDLIVTRDPKGFRGARIRVMSPETALPLLIRA